MKNRTLLHQKILPALALLCVVWLPHSSAQDAPVEATAVASVQATTAPLDSLGKAAERFVNAFNQKDAAGIAALFTPLGEIIWKDGETLAGRQAIEDYYLELFAGEKVP